MHMKAKRIIFIAALGLASIGAGWWLSHRDGGLTNQARNGIGPASASPAPTASDRQPTPLPLPREDQPGQAQPGDYRTIEEAMSEADLRRHLQEWARDGWNVLSISKPLPQADGTIHRKVELQKAGR